jgi:hypothetical protein
LIIKKTLINFGKKLDQKLQQEINRLQLIVNKKQFQINIYIAILFILVIGWNITLTLLLYRGGFG